MPAKLVVCGPKKSGKTTLICRLIPLLQSKGLQVAVLKHASHSHPLDKPGADTDRFREAGAPLAALLTPEGFAIFSSRLEEPDAIIDGHFAGADLVLIEGMGSSPWPKLVIRPSLDPSYAEAIDAGTVLAIVDDPASEVPPAFGNVRLRFRSDEVERIAQWVVGEWFSEGKKRARRA